MEDLLGFVLIGLFLDVIFWGISYATGAVLAPIISLGRWKPESISLNKEGGGRRSKQNGFTLIEKDKQVYLGALAVAFIGLVFWVVVIILLCIS